MKLKSFTKAFAAPLSFATLMALSTGTQAALMDVTVTIENLAPTNSVSFAPLRLGFHNGTFDAFDAGSAASDAIISIAEGGSGTKWFADFEAAEPNAVLGSVVNGGPSIPSANAGVGNGFSATASNTFRVDTSDNAFFSFANMVVPSNDLFLGNDNPLRLFDNLGSLLFSEIRLTASDIWDANSEVADASAGAFIPGGVNGNRTAENGLVAFDFSEFAAFDGLTTAAGYDFDFSLLDDDTAIYSIAFEANTVDVSAPSTFALLGLAFFAIAGRNAQKRKLKVATNP